MFTIYHKCTTKTNTKFQIYIIYFDIFETSQNTLFIYILFKYEYFYLFKV